MNKPKVGDTVFRVRGCRRSEIGDRNPLVPSRVTRVGRKYFYVQDTDKENRPLEFSRKFSLETWYEVKDFGMPVRVYPSEEAYRSSVLAGKQANILMYRVAWRNLSPEQLSAVVETLKRHGVEVDLG